MVVVLVRGPGVAVLFVIGEELLLTLDCCDAECDPL